MKLQTKDLLGLRHTTKEEIGFILQTAGKMKASLKSDSKKAPYLTGKTVITLFYENSTRTRLSFELAAMYMCGNALNISVSTSSTAKGETLIDTGRTIDAMAPDVIVMRHPMSGAPHLLSKYVKASVINAGDGTNEHPTQALLDMFTILEKKGRLEGLKTAIIGDIYHSRVARSNIWGLTRMGARVCIGGPSTLIPPGIEKMGVEVFNSIEKVVEGADIVMGLRIQKERQKAGMSPSLEEYSKFFGVNENVLKLAKEDVLVMHPGPVNRGVEMPSTIIDGPRSVIDEQVTNGVAVRMALLYILTGRGDKDESSDKKR